MQVTANDRCGRCAERLADDSWSYSYGLKRRGMSPRTGKLDDRPLGVDSVALCGPCERHILRASLRSLLGETPAEMASNLVGIGVAISGAYFAEATFSYGVLLLLAGIWTTIVFLLRRPKAMRKGVFLMRRSALARMHGVATSEIELYPDAV